jgi:putative Mn2+ efflux pump MntP
MLQVLFGSFILSLLHATIPSHWLPVVALARSEKWSRREALLVTGISGLAHTASTVLIGITVGFIGFRLSESYETISEKAASALLVAMGIVYLLIDRFHAGRHRHGEEQPGYEKRSKWAVVLTLSVAMFFSPCLEIEAFYFQAGTLGWAAISTVSAIYILVTVAGMIVLVDLGLKGVARVRSHFLDHHEKLLSGIVLIVLGTIAWFVHL